MFLAPQLLYTPQWNWSYVHQLPNWGTTLCLINNAHAASATEDLPKICQTPLKNCPSFPRSTPENPNNYQHLSQTIITHTKNMQARVQLWPGFNIFLPNICQNRKPPPFTKTKTKRHTWTLPHFTDIKFLGEFPTISWCFSALQHLGGPSSMSSYPDVEPWELPSPQHSGFHRSVTEPASVEGQMSISHVECVKRICSVMSCGCDLIWCNVCMCVYNWCIHTYVNHCSCCTPFLKANFEW